MSARKSKQREKKSSPVTTSRLSPQDEALLLAFRTFGNQLNALLAKIEAQFVGRALMVGLREGTSEQSTSIDQQ